jgi:hypothetical protein
MLSPNVKLPPRANPDPGFVIEIDVAIGLVSPIPPPCPFMVIGMFDALI